MSVVVGRTIAGVSASAPLTKGPTVATKDLTLEEFGSTVAENDTCLLYTSPSPRD